MVTREATAKHVAFLRLEESGFGFGLERRDAADKPVRIQSLRSTVTVVFDGTPLSGQVTTEPDEHGGTPPL